MTKAFLYLESGEELEATSFAYQTEKPMLSEIVFNTSMQGYQEIITDPSYCDQSIVMTYPLIGNYGINQDDSEAIIPHLKTLIVREYCEEPSNFRSTKSLKDFLTLKKIQGLCHVDTRYLTKIIRKHGTMKCLISKDKLTQGQREDLFGAELTTDQIPKISTKAISHFPCNGGKRVVLIDFGYKKNILESLIKRECDVIVVPWDTDYESIRDFNPSGILLSNGPGDPKSILKVIPTIQKLQEVYPLFAICMGHQIFALANGGDTAKMKFGHRGSNHPVQDLKTKRVFITAQNHGYCVKENSLSESELEASHINLNDKSIEGLKHKTKPAFSVQFHPEANPGPHDTKYLFDQFINLMNEEDQNA
jgi:carbamoyl-phosphate synthase small subunit